MVVAGQLDADCVAALELNTEEIDSIRERYQDA